MYIFRLDDINELTLEITNQCFQKCAHCSSRSHSEIITSEQMTVKQMLRIILAFPNLQYLNISGGEPFLNIENLRILLRIIQWNKIYYKYLSREQLTYPGYKSDILEYVPDMVYDRMFANLKVTIYTCGFYPKEISNKYLGSIIDLLENDTDKIIFSLNTYNYEKYGNDFNGVIDNEGFYHPIDIIKFMMEDIEVHSEENNVDDDKYIYQWEYGILHKQFQYTKNFGQPNIEFNYVPTKLNRNCFEKILDFINTLDSKYKKINILRNVAQGRQDKDKNNLDIDIEEFYNYYLYKWKFLYPEIKFRFGSPFNCVKLGIDGSPCTAGRDKLLINSRGYIFPCEAFKFLEYRDTKSNNKFLKPEYNVKLPLDTDNQEEFNKGIVKAIHCNMIFEWLERLREKKEFIKECQGCSRYDICLGGCPGQRELYKDILSGPDPMCKSKKN